MCITKKGLNYSLVKNLSVLCGYIKLQPITILHKDYVNVALIFITPEFRNTIAIKLLVYNIKKIINVPIIVDGTVFKGGESLIKTLSRNKDINISILDKVSGEISPLTLGLNDPSKCYVFA